MTRRPRATLALALLVTTGCVSAYPVTPRGRTATLHANDGLTWQGELLAASRDSVWVLNGNHIERYDVTSLRRIEIPRHRLGAPATISTSAAIGIATGLALTVACNRYNRTRPSGDDPADCVGVLPLTTILATLTGALFAIPNHFSSRHRVSPGDTDKLRTFARFPQGLPDTVSVVRLLPRP